MNKIDLNNKTAVVTGGAQGFGYAIARRFVFSGAKVIIFDKDPEAISSAINNKEINFEDTYEVDITNFGDLSEKRYGLAAASNGHGGLS